MLWQLATPNCSKSSEVFAFWVSTIEPRQHAKAPLISHNYLLMHTQTNFQVNARLIFYQKTGSNDITCFCILAIRFLMCVFQYVTPIQTMQLALESLKLHIQAWVLISGTNHNCAQIVVHIEF